VLKAGIPVSDRVLYELEQIIFLCYHDVHADFYFIFPAVLRRVFGKVAYPPVPVCSDHGDAGRQVQLFGGNALGHNGDVGAPFGVLFYDLGQINVAYDIAVREHHMFLAALGYKAHHGYKRLKPRGVDPVGGGVFI
jgi:hypothetical protein